MITYVIEWLRLLKARLSEERGQDVVEYALLVGFIGMVLAVAFFTLPIDDALGRFVGSIGNCVDLNPPGEGGYTCP